MTKNVPEHIWRMAVVCSVFVEKRRRTGGKTENEEKKWKCVGEWFPVALMPVFNRLLFGLIRSIKREETMKTPFFHHENAINWISHFCLFTCVTQYIIWFHKINQFILEFEWCEANDARCTMNWKLRRVRVLGCVNCFVNIIWLWIWWSY